ncbi:MAG: diversity-generating retroelement protein Avd [Oscillospiraceae bacterium]|nr:diversity-generating retroelement protein Avd [Oscillospiraceae bacterium]
MQGKPKEFLTLQKVYDMIQYAYTALAQYPKSEKFGLVTDIKRTMDDILGLCIEVQKRHHKKTTLTNLDIAIAKLKAYIRLSSDLKYLPPKKQGLWSEMVIEIGKMVGGMLKAENQQSANHRE